MRLFNKRSRKLLPAAGGRQRLGALLLAAMLFGSAAPAGAAETYRGDDPDSYECSSDYNILNRFSAPPGVPTAQSTKYADVKFTKTNNLISVKDASNSRELAYVSVGENAKYCALKEMQVLDEKTFDPRECRKKYNLFRVRIVVDSELPVRKFSPLVRTSEKPKLFDKMNHSVDVDLYRTADWNKRRVMAKCFGFGGTPEIDYYSLRYLDLTTSNKSYISVAEVAPLELRQGDVYIEYKREATKKAGSGIPRPK